MKPKQVISRQMFELQKALCTGVYISGFDDNGAIIEKYDVDAALRERYEIAEEGVGPVKVFLVAFFKFDIRGPEHGFKRISLQTFYTSLEDAEYQSKASFCDEAGFYEGVLVEEREEGNPFFQGKRFFYLRDPGNGPNGWVDFEEPEFYKNIVGLIS